MLRDNRQALSARQADHAADLLTAEYVDVIVRHFLAAIAADIGDDAIAALRQAESVHDLGDRSGEADDLRLRSLRRKILGRDIGALRDDQRVDLGLGTD